MDSLILWIKIQILMSLSNILLSHCKIQITPFSWSVIQGSVSHWEDELIINQPMTAPRLCRSLLFNGSTCTIHLPLVTDRPVKPYFLFLWYTPFSVVLFLLQGPSSRWEKCLSLIFKNLRDCIPDHIWVDARDLTLQQYA